MFYCLKSVKTVVFTHIVVVDARDMNMLLSALMNMPEYMNLGFSLIYGIS